MKNMINRLARIAVAVGVGSVGLYVLLWRLGYVVSPRILWSRRQSADCKIVALQPESPLHRPPSAAQVRLTDRAIEALVTATPFRNSQVSLLIEKSKYRLTIYYQKQPIKSYAIVLGSSPIGDKRQEGDNKTPEGLFRIQDHYPHPQWSQFLWLDYPTQTSWNKHCRAKQTGEIRAQATIGGEIGIHGVPPGKNSWIEQRKNWTWGCISLKNRDINELSRVVQVGTVVEIVP
jgi:murein L,D-transpeptidase YafK